MTLWALYSRLVADPFDIQLLILPNVSMHMPLGNKRHSHARTDQVGFVSVQSMRYEQRRPAAWYGD